MMKLRVLSDLHLEGTSFTYAPQNEDVLVMAGDISSRTSIYQDLIKNVVVPIIVVPGNHEFYGHEFNSRLTELKELGYLYNEVKVIEDVHFICGTGWTDFRLNDTSPIDKINAQQCINDFSAIKVKQSDSVYRRWSPNDCQKENLKYNSFMERALETTRGEKRVVVSHFLPLLECIHTKYINSPVNAYFASDMSRFVNEVSLWIHGHTHDSIDMVYNSCRIVCNPRGYGKENKENFIKDLIIEV